MDTVAFLILAWILKQLGGGSPSTPSTPSKTPKGPPPKFPGPKPIPVPGTPNAAAATTYRIQSGDTPFGLATRYAHQGSRWREILAANPSLQTKTTNGVTQITPWNIGQQINWPSGWDAPQAGGSPGPSAGPATSPAAPPGMDPSQVIHDSPSAPFPGR